MRVGAIVQARMTSSRLPGKVLLPLPPDNKSVLNHVVRRLQKSNRLDTVVIATTTDKEDDEIAVEAQSLDVPAFRGDRANVLDRFYQTACNEGLDVIVRITSDCPCIDWELVDQGIEVHLESKADFSSTLFRRDLPYGLDFGIISFRALEKSHREATEDFEKEHVTPFIYKSHPDKFLINQLNFSSVTPQSTFRVTLDTKEDYTLLRAVYDLMDEKAHDFRLKDLSELFARYSWLTTINQEVVQKKALKNLSEEIKEVRAYCEKQDLHRFKAFLQNYKDSI